MGEFSPAPRSCLDERREPSARETASIGPAGRLALAILTVVATALAGAVAASARPAAQGST